MLQAKDGGQRASCDVMCDKRELRKDQKTESRQLVESLNIQLLGSIVGQRNGNDYVVEGMEGAGIGPRIPFLQIKTDRPNFLLG